MRSPHLILTVDYEVFGNGLGCISHCVLDPAERIMRIAEDFSAPITFFVDTTEFMAMENGLREERPGIQIMQAVSRGHDAQLHIHPQWADATYDRKTATWKVDEKRWRIGDLPWDQVHSLIQEGKNWLETKVSSAGFLCIAFRAGGWCIQPAKTVLNALQDSGFKIDSTVAPGFWNGSRLEWNDFRQVPRLPFWPVQEDVCKAEPVGILEVPIATGRIDRIRHFRAWRESRKIQGGFAPNCRGSYQIADDRLFERIRGKGSKLMRLGQVMLDLSTMPADILIEVTQQWINSHEGVSEIPLPIVAIAHTKNFTEASENALRVYLDWVKRSGLRFSTFQEWLAMYDEPR